MCMSRIGTLYHRHVAPIVVHGGCSMSAFTRMRQRVIHGAEGTVVEVGFGSGLNLPHYDPGKVKHLIGIDPDPSMLAIAQREMARATVRAECLQASGENIPLESGYADTAVVSYALCTIPNPSAALGEIRRILKPGGRLLFLEHGRSERWHGSLQDRLNRPWQFIAGGCNLNREPTELIEKAGFALLEANRERFAISLWLLGNHYSGVAAPR
jgi:ubiquinone/menaquinone biosynthesis C-methylase UbiE